LLRRSRAHTGFHAFCRQGIKTSGGDDPAEIAAEIATAVSSAGRPGVSPIPAEGGSVQPVAIVANLTGVAGTAATVLVLYPNLVNPRPQASDLNPAAGQVIANLAIVGLAQTGPTTGEVTLYNNLGTIDAILDVAGWFQ
jgi:hypothetical protein